MARLRLLAPWRCRLLLALFAVAMLSRALVPSGWMPVAGAAGFRLGLCDGAAAMPMPGMAHGKVPMHHQGQTDHPCDFAQPAAATDMPELIVPVPPARARYTPAVRRAAVTIGQGLAAPPPPATGPPAIA